MVSQFKSSHAVPLLDLLAYSFPEGTHAIGRLDKESEGLLILTTNKRVTRLLFQSAVPHRRTYLVQLKKPVSDRQLQQLRDGVWIPVKDSVQYAAQVVEASMVNQPENLQKLLHDPFVPVDHCWIVLTLTEGKFHQVRKMMTAIENRCLRLIRLSIEDLTLDGLAPGEIREIDEAAFFSRLKIKQCEESAGSTHHKK